MMKSPSAQNTHPHFDAVIVGAGFAGLHMLYRLRHIGLTCRVLEAGDDVGGAWYWNRYPGARCDVESLVYSYSFSPELDTEWRWTERYAAQPEIQAYLKFASERLDLRKDIQFSTKVTRATFDDDLNAWSLQSDTGTTLTARFCIMATGPISLPVMPNIDGIDDFKGEFHHTALWPKKEPTFTGKRVGVIGTGSSGTQLIPEVAKKADRLFVFQRTPNFSVPANNGPLTNEHYAEWIRRRDEIRAAQARGEVSGAGDVLIAEDLRRTRITPSTQYTIAERRDILERRFAAGGAIVQQSFNDLLTNESINAEVADFLRSQIKKRVKDPTLAELLTPRDYALGTRRICVDTGYYETFNRSNVELVDVKTAPIERLTENGLVTGGREISLDIIIMATGFDALTGALTAIDLRGTNGRTIKDAWGPGPQTYLGVAINGFPNLFMIGGPGSPSVLTNVVMTNEFQVDFITNLIADIYAAGQDYVEANADAQIDWTNHVNKLVEGTAFEHADSWYVGTNIPGKPRVILAYTAGIVAYRSVCTAAKEDDYRGFSRSAKQHSSDRHPTAPVAVAKLG